MMRVILCFLCLAAFLGWGNAVAGAAAEPPYPVSEFRLFALQERTVAAVAIDHRLPGNDIENVLGYRLTPVFEEKRTAGRAGRVLRHSR